MVTIPRPMMGESEGEYMVRCMRVMMEEEGMRDERQGYARCKGMWESFKDRGGKEGKVGGKKPSRRGKRG